MKNVLLLLLIFSGYSVAKTSPACSSETYRQFDFWVGEWDVVAKGGQQKTPSKSKISKIIDDCVIFEEYSTPSGYVGKSLNIYDRQTGMWHQSWTDNSGLMLKLDGEFKDGNMVLKGETLDAKGQKIANRVTWTALDDGTVRQHWQQSTDEGKNWTTAFDGIYHPRK